MAEFKKKPQQGPKLPAPPAMEEAPKNLYAPETAPAATLDGRSVRATGRTEQFATRVREEFHDELKLYGATHGLKQVEILELGLQALKATGRTKEFYRNLKHYAETRRLTLAEALDSNFKPS